MTIVQAKHSAFSAGLYTILRRYDDGKSDDSLIRVGILSMELSRVYEETLALLERIYEQKHKPKATG